MGTAVEVDEGKYVAAGQGIAVGDVGSSSDVLVFIQPSNKQSVPSSCRDSSELQIDGSHYVCKHARLILEQKKSLLKHEAPSLDHLPSRLKSQP